MNRKDFRGLARQRLTEARALLDAGHAPGAYYLLGYAVECGLKAAIAKQTRATDFPPPRKIVDRIYTHDLVGLVKAAGLQADLELELQVNLAFEKNWALVSTWSEDDRYVLRTMPEATDLHTAVTHTRHGVMRWVRQHW